jgi:hypothetical protein
MEVVMKLKIRLIFLVCALSVIALFLLSCKVIEKDLLKTNTEQTTRFVDEENFVAIPVPEQTPVSSPEPESIKLVEYEGPIYHIFFHSLIAFPEIAYSKEAGGAFDTDCVTIEEFKSTLEELYKNNFVLIDIRSTYESVTEDGKQVVKDKKISLPEGKKPIIISIDDMVYDPLKMGLGMVDKIILDEKGSFATYTKHRDGTEVISYDNEVIPILEQFIKTHPDFSLNGARATLAVTGWVGVLGYRIDRLAPNRQSEIDEVKPIVEKLKETGWTFACHGYGHRHSRDISYALFEDDTNKWLKEIGSVIGSTDIYVYPYGQILPTTDSKYKLLLDKGFKIMCGVNNKPSWINYGHSIFMDRQGIDGYSLRNYRESLGPILDTEKVIDLENRKILKK